ncbi:Adenylate cyclase type 10 [Phytophthora nicotianae]|uniref:Adenylate cyclase type 10 n=1 Tax=Phytophthora nicotianae TaxID=4792 RepID=A0A0W8CM02_PHYNI|nr:hypothetical protein AM588_10000837 [Phytophthora nicotianae]KUF95139.1 Adenylate cyclase type 10 [Phytophthora nicotianae]
MVLSLIRQGVADAQIRAIFGVGGSMIQRLKLTRKLTSLSLKYFSIPAQYLDYFPPIQEAIESEETTSDATKAQDRVTKRKAAPGAQPPAKKPIGRPRKVQPRPSNPSILSFFKPIDK